jgi:hypothetical protein
VRSENGGDALNNGSVSQRDTVSWATPQAQKQGYGVGRRRADQQVRSRTEERRHGPRLRWRPDAAEFASGGVNAEREESWGAAQIGADREGLAFVWACVIIGPLAWACYVALLVWLANSLRAGSLFLAS